MGRMWAWFQRREKEAGKDKKEEERGEEEKASREEEEEGEEGERERREMSDKSLEVNMERENKASLVNYQVPQGHAHTGNHAHTGSHSHSLTPQSKCDSSLLEGPTPANTYGFKISQSEVASTCDTHEVTM